MIRKPPELGWPVLPAPDGRRPAVTGEPDPMTVIKIRKPGDPPGRAVVGIPRSWAAVSGGGKTEHEQTRRSGPGGRRPRWRTG
jgi:hypothetical protein